MERRRVLIEQIKTTYDTLRPSEQRVADLLLQDLNAFKAMSPMQIAVESNVSEATIARVCKAVGLNGLRQLREQIGDEMCKFSQFDVGSEQ